MFLYIFNLFGSFGPFILFFTSIFLLWKRHNLFFYYVVGVFSNVLLNLILKSIIQQPRPNEDIRQFNLALSRGKKILFKDGIPYDIFGMPSGHAQSCLFSTIFIFFSLKNVNILYFYAAVSLITLLQRVVFECHLILQIIVGSILGAVFGYFIYWLAGEKIKGHITEKIDDYGPI